MSTADWPAVATARTFAGPSDFAAVADVFNASVHADHDESMSTAAEVENDFLNTAGLDLDSGLLIVEAEGRPVAYLVARSYRETAGTRIYRHMGKLRPEYRRMRIGTAMLQWAQRYLVGLAADHNDEEDRQFQTDADDGERGAVVLLTGDGYTAVAHNVGMVRPTLTDVPDRRLPAGVEIRPAREEHLRQIWEADAAAFEDHFGAAVPTEEEYQRFVNDPIHDLGLWKIAWHGDEIVGQVRSFINEAANAEFGRKRGYTEDISTARGWRGKGIASALICASLHELADRDMEEAGLYVHVDNPTGAFRLYEGLGFQMINSSATYQRPLAPADFHS